MGTLAIFDEEGMVTRHASAECPLSLRQSAKSMQNASVRNAPRDAHDMPQDPASGTGSPSGSARQDAMANLRYGKDRISNTK